MACWTADQLGPGELQAHTRTQHIHSALSSRWLVCANGRYAQALTRKAAGSSQSVCVCACVRTLGTRACMCVCMCARSALMHVCVCACVHTAGTDGCERGWQGWCTAAAPGCARRGCIPCDLVVCSCTLVVFVLLQLKRGSSLHQAQEGVIGAPKGWRVRGPGAAPACRGRSAPGRATSRCQTASCRRSRRRPRARSCLSATWRYALCRRMVTLCTLAVSGWMSVGGTCTLPKGAVVPERHLEVCPAGKGSIAHSWSSLCMSGWVWVFVFVSL